MAGLEQKYHFPPEATPSFPGSPFALTHPIARRAGYAALAVLVGICATLGNALITVNILTLPGSIGLYTAEASWLISLYVAFSATANLLLVRCRMQFGIPAVTLSLLSAYALATLIQVLVPGVATTFLVCAGSGVAAAALTTLTTYNLLQVFSEKYRPLALCIGVSLPQLGSPLARMFSVDLLALAQWQGLHLIELTLVLTVIAGLVALPLPPSQRVKAFEPLDLLTVAFALPGMVLFCGALAAARYVWWTDTPWLGWAFASSVLLIAGVIIIELNRKRPLLQIGWLTTAEMARFVAVAMLVRFALAEQTYGIVGLLTANAGLTNDQLHTLFLFVILAMIAGIGAACVTLSETSMPYQVAAAALLIAIGAWLDSGSTNLSRPQQLYFSQILLSFGATLFYGPALLYGILRVLRLGPDYLVSCIVIFSITQNVGSLLGSTLLGTYEVIQARAHAGSISEELITSNPLVAARLAEQGPTALYASMQREAAVLAFDDVFRAVAVIAFGTAMFIFLAIFWKRARGSRSVELA